jgi:hypothetical protein
MFITFFQTAFILVNPYCDRMTPFEKAAQRQVQTTGLAFE